MLPTTKEPAVGALPDTELPSNADGPGGSLPRRTDAVGAEIPVVVHASRYSSATVGGGKKLPPVHEETRTVIVFPNGAVVRISAAMAAGELVVLTNKQTGADVICRVVNVKAQPGIQNYVNLEFTQRAPGFWDANSPVASNVRQEPPQPLSKSLLPAPAVPGETGAAEPQIVAPKSAPAASPAKVAIDSSLVPVPLKVEKPHSPMVLSSSSLLGTDSGLNQKPIGASTDTAQTKNWAGPSHAAARTSDEVSGSKKVLLIAGAALVLLSVGAAGGAWLLRRTPRPAAQSEANSPEQSVPLPPVSPSPDSGVPPQQDVTASSPGLQSAVSASDTNGPPSVPAAQPAAARSLIEQPNAQSSEGTNGQSIGRPVAAPAPVQHSRIAVEKLAAPVSKAPAVPDAVQAPPVMGGQISGLVASGALGGSIAGEVPRVNAPAVPVRTGGQFQPAKSIASPAPSYPSTALSKRIEGVVTIDAELDNTGRIVSTKVISGPPELQLAALTALRKWKYQPAMLDGLAIESHTTVNLSFHLPSSLASRPK